MKLLICCTTQSAGVFYANQFNQELKRQNDRQKKIRKLQQRSQKVKTSAAETSLPQASALADVEKGTSSAASSADASHKKRKSTEEDNCLEAVKNYFV